MWMNMKTNILLSENKRLALNMLISGIALAIQTIINFWLSPFILSKLGEEHLGFITLCNNFTDYGTIIAISINSMASRFMSLEYNRGNIEKSISYFASVFWCNVIFSTIVIFTSIVVICNIQVINIDPALVNDVKIALFLTFSNLILSFISTCYVAVPFITNRMNINAITQLISKLATSALIIFLFLVYPAKLYYVQFSTVCSTLILLILSIIIKFRYLPDFSISYKFFSFKCIYTLFKSGFWVLISNINSIMLEGMDLLIANKYISSASMGRLSIAKQIPAAIGSVLWSISSVISASLTKAFSNNNKNDFIERLYFSFKILGFLFGVPFAGIIVFGYSFYLLWLPSNIYAQNDIQQIYVLMLLILTNCLINAFMYCIHSMLIAMDKIRIYSIICFICGVISIISTLLITANTNLGLYAISGTSTVVLGFVNLIVIPLYAEKAASVKKHSFLKKIAKNYYVFGILLIIFYLTKLIITLNTWLKFAISIIMLAIIGYTISFLMFFNKEERKNLINIIVKRR